LGNTLSIAFAEVGFPGYSCHRPRQLARTALGEAGATVDKIMSVLVHTTLEIARLYVQQTNPKRLWPRTRQRKWEQATTESC
jgi:hypothetical protein